MVHSGNDKRILQPVSIGGISITTNLKISGFARDIRSSFCPETVPYVQFLFLVLAWLPLQVGAKTNAETTYSVYLFCIVNS